MRVCVCVCVCVEVAVSLCLSACLSVDVTQVSGEKVSRISLSELSLETVPSLLPVRQYGTVCQSLLNQLRTLASFKRKLKTYLFTFHFYWFLSFIDFVMPSRSVFVIGWALN